ncbi:hypothetical protein THI2018120TP_08810 [Staphylococcus aureus]|nr:hypothetical protein THI2018120TP_08810 [Staphylococcus aureus]BCQ14869.1 hypothetical protein N1195TP_08800 [Staphylococcus aureus]BCQ20073.1 hypothetical protein S36TP_07790 [Staphylococcus aureus]
MVKQCPCNTLFSMQVGGAPTQKLVESQLTIMCKLGRGPEHREFLIKPGWDINQCSMLYEVILAVVD